MEADFKNLGPNVRALAMERLLSIQQRRQKGKTGLDLMVHTSATMVEMLPQDAAEAVDWVKNACRVIRESKGAFMYSDDETIAAEILSGVGHKPPVVASFEAIFGSARPCPDHFRRKVLGGDEN